MEGGRPNDGIQFGFRGRGSRAADALAGIVPSCGGCRGGAESEEWQKHVGAGAGVWS